MTQQTLRERVAVDISKCLNCHCFDDSGVFELCRDKSAQYRNGPQLEYHTAQHMRETRLCQR